MKQICENDEDLHKHNNGSTKNIDSMLPPIIVSTSINDEEIPNDIIWINYRTILWLLVFSGLAVNYMIRININIAIIDMVAQNNDSLKMYANSSSDNNSTTTECKFSFEEKTLKFFHVLDHEIDHNFVWNEIDQNLILGSYYWLTFLSPIPGGVLARIYGTKIIFGLAIFGGCILSFLIPLASFIDIRLLVAIRCLQGFIMGVSWPAVQQLCALWIPPNERSKFVSSYMGSSIGLFLFYPLFGFVLQWTNCWQSVFYLTTIFGIVWYICWQYFVYDSPNLHPRISVAEKEYIMASICNSVKHQSQDPIPWKKILHSRPVWMIVIAQFGSLWTILTLMTQSPTYLKENYDWNIQSAGILSGLPHLFKTIFSVAFSTWADNLLIENKMSRTNVRKLSTFVCSIIGGLAIIALAYSGNHSLYAVGFFTIAVVTNGAVSAGPVANVIDLSPNYAAVVMGIAQTVSVFSGFISPYVVGYLTLNNHSQEQWKIVFLVTGAISIGTGIIYIMFAKSDLQNWNRKEMDEEEEEEDNF